MSMNKTPRANRTHIAIFGRRNVGKSSVINALTNQSISLVSDVAGTTTDPVFKSMEILPLGPCVLIDTAGIEHLPFPDSTNSLPLDPRHTAQRFTHRQRIAANIEIHCTDAISPLESAPVSDLSALPSESPDTGSAARTIEVLTKCDRLPDEISHPLANTAITTSSNTGTGLQPLVDIIRQQLHDLQHTSSDVVTGTALRCRRSLELCRMSLDHAIELLLRSEAEELIASEIRTALNHLGMVVGAVHTDDILDRVFSRFCIGK